MSEAERQAQNMVDLLERSGLRNVKAEGDLVGFPLASGRYILMQVRVVTHPGLDEAILSSLFREQP